MIAPCMWRSWGEQKDELRSFLRRRLADTPATEDVLHEIFVKAALQADKFCQIGHPRAWFFQVARNAVADRHRRGQVFEPVPDDLPAASQDIPPVEALAQCLPQALAALKQEDRDAVECCEIERMTQREYAALRGLSLPAAKSRVQRARAKLREILISQCGVRFDEQTGQVCCHVPPGSRG